jgi:hypothetical protein
MASTIERTREMRSGNSTVLILSLLILSKYRVRTCPVDPPKNELPDSYPDDVEDEGGSTKHH